MIGCGTARVRAPPASGRPSASSRPPSPARNWSGPGEAAASSSSQARGAARSMPRSCDYGPGLSSAPRRCESRSLLAAEPGIRARVVPGGDLREPADVMRPTFRMAGALLGIRQARVGQAKQRSVRLLDQIDLDQARPRRHLLAVVPAEAVGQAVHRHHFAEGAAGEASPGDIEEIESAGLRLELRLRSHPAQNLLRIGEEGEDRGGRRRDARLAADDEGLLLHRSSPDQGLTCPMWRTPDQRPRAPRRRLPIALSQGAEWKALISTYIGTIPFSGNA